MGNRISLNFDLHQDELKRAGFKNTLNAYKELGKNLKKIGFEKRQQSSWISIQNLSVTDTVVIIREIQRKLTWFSDSVNTITATTENAVLDLKPLIHEGMSKNEFIDLENTRGESSQKRAIHFDLGIKEVDELYKHRSTPYAEISKAMKELGFQRQQGSGYVSDSELSAEEFAERMVTLSSKVPNLKKIVKHIDATHLKDVWDLTPYIKENERVNIKIDTENSGEKVKKFSLKHLQAIHKDLFKDIDKNAGELRKSDDSGQTKSCLAEHIESFGDVIFNKLAQAKYLRGLNHETFVNSFTDFASDIHILKPFEEGNYEANNHLLSNIAEEAGYKFDWEHIKKNDFMNAAGDDMNSDQKSLKEMIAPAIKPIRFNEVKQVKEKSQDFVME